jgi:hypothetical protein
LSSAKRLRRLAIRAREREHFVEGRFADPGGGASAHSAHVEARTFTERQNEFIVEKAIRYAPRGIVGIDIAGPRPSADGPYPYRTLRPLVQQARDAGLG